MTIGKWINYLVYDVRAIHNNPPNNSYNRILLRMWSSNKTISALEMHYRKYHEERTHRDVIYLALHLYI